MAALPALIVAVLAGCTAHHAVSRVRQRSRPPAAKETARPPAGKHAPCRAAELTGRIGLIGLGAGQYTQHLVLTNNSRRACTLGGGPSRITGVRQDGRRVRLATGASSAAGRLYGLVGPVSLKPGQSAQVVIHTTTLCSKSSSSRASNYIALDVGIARSGQVQINFPPGQPCDAICGIDVSPFGIPASK
jgi:hypothetical protein